jgi:hypothetical protein
MKNKKSTYTILSIGYIGIIITIVFLALTSCSTSHLPVAVISENGTNWYSTPEGRAIKHASKRVVAKDKDKYGYYLIALEDGSTYYCTFGEYSLIYINDYIMFNRRMTKIININR